MYIWTSQSKMITWLHIKSSLPWHVQEGHAPHPGATTSPVPSRGGPSHQRMRDRPAVEQARHSHQNNAMGKSSPGVKQMCCHNLLKWFKICKINKGNIWGFVYWVRWQRTHSAWTKSVHRPARVCRFVPLYRKVSIDLLGSAGLWLCPQIRWRSIPKSVHRPAKVSRFVNTGPKNVSLYRKLSIDLLGSAGL